MSLIPHVQHRWQFSTLLILSIVSFAVPHASQDNASDEFILFASDRAFPSQAGICASCEDIYVMPPAGELPGVPDAIRLTAGSGVDSASYNSAGPDWSRAKQLIAFQSNRPTDPVNRPLERVPQIYLMNPDGTGQRLLVNLPRGAAFPSFSHNGNELCFHSQTMPRRDIYIVNVHGTGLTNLTSPAQSPGVTGVAGDNLRCDWSPKANAIAFASNRHDPADTLPADRNDEIYVMNADGTDVVRLTDVAGSDANPAWSPKGDKIAFESNRSGRPEIWVMNADGSEPVRLTNFDADITPSNVNVTKPTWSPKGDRIAFHRRVTPVAGMRGHLEVYTMNADGTGVPTRITFSEDPGFSGFPSWNAMTRHLVPGAALAVALMLPQHAITAAKPSSNFVDLGTLGGGFSDAFGINNDPGSVQVVGRSTRADGFTHAFFWTAPGPMVDLGTFGGGSSDAWDINDHRQVAGSSEDASRQQWAAVWRRAAGAWTIENLGTVTGACCAHAHGINNGTAGNPAGVAVVGGSTVGSGATHAALWTMSAGGWAVQTLGTLPGDAFSNAHDVNDAGAVVGVSGSGDGTGSAFLWTAAAGMSRLPGLGGNTTYALAISSGGDVAGLSTDLSGTRHAVRWRSSAGWAVEDLGTLGGCCSEGYGINTFGDVVGVSRLGNRSGTSRAFLARPAAAMTDIALQGQSVARDLNDFGVVVGGSGRGPSHAVVWRLP